MVGWIANIDGWIDKKLMDGWMDRKKIDEKIDGWLNGYKFV